MSVRTLAIAIPTALITLGFVAAASANTLHSPASAPTVFHSEAWGIDKVTVGYKKKRAYSTWKRKSRFSGFGFRGDGFRTSGKYK